jgi:hypothetical protein
MAHSLSARWDVDSFSGDEYFGESRAQHGTGYFCEWLGAGAMWLFKGGADY